MVDKLIYVPSLTNYYRFVAIVLMLIYFLDIRAFFLVKKN